MKVSQIVSIATALAMPAMSLPATSEDPDLSARGSVRGCQSLRQACSHIGSTEKCCQGARVGERRVCTQSSFRSGGVCLLSAGTKAKAKRSDYFSNTALHSQLDDLEAQAANATDEETVQGLKAQAQEMVTEYGDGLQYPDGDEMVLSKRAICAVRTNCDQLHPGVVCGGTKNFGYQCSVCRPNIHTCRPELGVF